MSNSLTFEEVGEGYPTRVFPTFVHPEGNSSQHLPPGRFVDHPNDSIDPDAEWGKYIIPPDHYLDMRAMNLERDENTLRVVQLGSYMRGLYVGMALFEKEREDPGKIEMRGIATDGIVDTDSRVTAQRRVWQYMTDEQRDQYQEVMQELAWRNGVPAYSGKVKSHFFHDTVLPQWNPNVILMSTFGQLIDEPIIAYPQFGMYNFHPSDLANGKYPGGNPFNEMIEAGERTTRMTVHKVDTGFDTGDVVGYSPEINIHHGRDAIRRGLWIQALHIRTSRVAGIMTKRLLDEIYTTRNRVDTIDMETIFSEEEQKELMEPLEISDQMYLNDLIEQRKEG